MFRRIGTVLWYHKTKVFLGTAVGVAGTIPGLYFYGKSKFQKVFKENPFNATYDDKVPLPKRSEILSRLKKEEFDVLIIGGGATGSACALDAQTRGLKVALVEMNDYASCTSSKSTKLIHGGLRYLEKAIKTLSWAQFEILLEALSERKNFLEVAPHLAYPLPIMVPAHTPFQLLQLYIGVKLYDLFSFGQHLKSSYLIDSATITEKFPILSKADIWGGVVYYDGGQDDSRTNLATIITAIRYGAACTNYAQVTSFSKDAKNMLNGATVKDCLTGEKFDVSAKVVVNATGPHTDVLRQLDDPKAEGICVQSSGVHVTLPSYYCPRDMGLLDPSTSDGRVIFFLPWQTGTIVGTTDLKCTLATGNNPTENSVQYILQETRKYISADMQIRRGDVCAAWSGIRPLVRDPTAKNTQSIARNHIILVSDSNLVTVAGGKWTTYRQMGQDTIDKVLSLHDFKLADSSCRTINLKLEGAHNYYPTLKYKLVQDLGLSEEVATNLASTYGDKAWRVAKKAGLTGYKHPVIGRRLHEMHPQIEAEVDYAIREYAVSVTDFIARRTRLAFLNAANAEEVVPRVADIMAKHFKWDDKRKAKECEAAREFLKTEMGLNLAKEARKAAALATPKELGISRDEELKWLRMFRKLDQSKTGTITVNDLKVFFKSSDQVHISGSQLSEMLDEVDSNNNGMIEPEEFLILMKLILTGTANDTRLSIAAHQASLHDDDTGGAKLGGGGL